MYRIHNSVNFKLICNGYLVKCTLNKLRNGIKIVYTRGVFTFKYVKALISVLYDDVMFLTYLARSELFVFTQPVVETLGLLNYRLVIYFCTRFI